MRLLLISLIALCALGASLATVASGDSRGDYTAYAKVRDNMRACYLDRTYDHLSSSEKRRCVRLRRLYVLYSDRAESNYHLHCKTRKCPPAPQGEPSPRSKIPAGSKIYR